MFSQMKDTKHIRQIFILSPGSWSRGGTTWGCLGVKIEFHPAVCPLCYLFLNHWKKFNQIWCVSYSHEWGVQQHFFLAPPPGALGRDQKVKYLISFTKSISKIFITKLYVCSLKWKIQNLSDGIFILSPGSCPRGVTLGAGGAQVVKNLLFSNMVMWHVKSTGMTSRTECK